MTIMITGATGQLGSLIINNLLNLLPANQIIAGVRNLDKSAYLKDSGVEVRLSDYEVPEALEEAFTGVSRLLLISSPHTEDKVRLAQHIHVIEAAKTAGVPHILYTSFAFSRPGNKNSSNVHAMTEQAILDSGLEYTILRNALYIDFVSVLGLAEAMGSGVLTTRPGDWQFNAVTRADLARASAHVLAGTGHEHQIYELAAAKTWTFKELAEVLSGLAGKPVILREEESLQHWIYHFLGSIDTASVSKDLEQLMGQPSASLRESILPFVNRTNV